MFKTEGCRKLNVECIHVEFEIQPTTSNCTFHTYF